MINIILIIVAALFFAGILNRAKSIFSGRKGPGIMQPVKDIIRLLKKGQVYPETASLIFKISPSVYLSTVIIGALFMPLGNLPGLISFPGDFVFFCLCAGSGQVL